MFHVLSLLAMSTIVVLYVFLLMYGCRILINIIYLLTYNTICTYLLLWSRFFSIALHCVSFLVVYCIVLFCFVVQCIIVCLAFWFIAF